MVPQGENFESVSVNIHEAGSFTNFDERDPGTNFFDDITKSNFQSSYFKQTKQRKNCTFVKKLNVLHVNIRSIKRNFENLKALSEKCELVFNIISVLETRFSNTKLQKKSNLSFTEFDCVPYEKSKNSRGGGVLIFIKKNLSYKIPKDFSESDEQREMFSLEISKKIPPI